jgi:hypothetical protein
LDWPISIIVYTGRTLKKYYWALSDWPPEPIFFTGHHGLGHGLYGRPLKELKKIIKKFIKTVLAKNKEF